MGDNSGNSQDYEEPKKKKFKTGENPNSDNEKACQTDGPWGWDTIIVNQIPPIADYDELISVFSQYGDIENSYMCKKLKWGGMKHERVARITFSNEDDALKVVTAFQEKLVKYKDHVLMVTLATTDYSPIQNLPDTCLREIFERVNSPKDKLNVEKVCRRWRDNGRCCWSNMKQIEAYNGGVNAWRTIFSRIANTLEYLHFSELSEEAEEVFGIAAEHCVNLKKLKCDFHEMRYDMCSLAMNTILQKNENLRCFQFHMFSSWDLDMNFMEFLPTDMYEIDIRACDTDAILETPAISMFVNLRILILHAIKITHHQVFDNLVNLEQLGLVDCNVPQASISTILRNNKDLKYLNIAIKNLSDASLRYIQQLPKLQVLAIESRPFTNAHLQAMSRLKALSCSRCSITDEGIQRYLDQASKITHISLFDCRTSLQSLLIARRWTKRTGNSLKISVDKYLFQEYSALRRRQTEKFTVTELDEYGIHETMEDDWSRELVE